MIRKKYHVCVNVQPRPKPHEESAAELVADFLRSDVEFIQTGSAKTPDLRISNQLWEMKSPTGSGSRTILHQFQRASLQAQYLVFDARRTKIDNQRCRRQVLAQFKKSRSIRRVIYISKDGTVEELEK